MGHTKKNIKKINKVAQKDVGFDITLLIGLG